MSVLQDNIVRILKLMDSERIRYAEALERGYSLEYRNDILERLRLLNLELIGFQIPPTGV